MDEKGIKCVNMHKLLRIVPDTAQISAPVVVIIDWVFLLIPLPLSVVLKEPTLNLEIQKRKVGNQFQNIYICVLEVEY